VNPRYPAHKTGALNRIAGGQQSFQALCYTSKKISIRAYAYFYQQTTGFWAQKGKPTSLFFKHNPTFFTFAWCNRDAMLILAPPEHILE